MSVFSGMFSKRKASQGYLHGVASWAGVETTSQAIGRLTGQTTSFVSGRPRSNSARSRAAARRRRNRLGQFVTGG